MKGLRLGEPSEDKLRALLRAASEADVTYDHVGSTLRGVGHQQRMRLGEGRFAAGRQALETWAAHRELHAALWPRQPPIEEGTTLLVILQAGPVRIVAPDRIVRVIDEPARFGFAYGTLPGHPERGEECFVIEQDSDGVVTASITVDAEPGTLLTRLGGPLVRRFQRRAIASYLRGIRRSACGPDGLRR